MTPKKIGSRSSVTEWASSMRALIAGSDSWVERVTWRRRSPTVLVSQKNAGTVISATMVSCQLRMTMATTVEVKMTTLARMLEAVGVTTDWEPPTSLGRRDWVSPGLGLGRKGGGGGCS